MKLQESQVRRRLRDDFEHAIDVSDIQNHQSDTQAEMRTSRALAAFTIAALADLSVEDACACVTDESGDQGIDAIGFSPVRNELYLVQAKASDGGPSPTEVQKFTRGIGYLLDLNWGMLGTKMNAKRGQIESFLDRPTYRIRAVYTFLGNQKPNDDCRDLSDRLLADVNSSGHILDFEYHGLRENFERRNIASGLDAIDHIFTFERWLTLGDYRSEVSGVVSGDQLAEVVNEYGERLFDKNIRSVLGATDVNELIDQTIKNDPTAFWYYNNGITIVATSITCMRPNPRASLEEFQLRGLSVVNGAQSCGALARAAREGLPLDDVKVTVRVISTEGHDDEFSDRVTRYTNMQNRVTGREFVSLDLMQQEMSDILRAEGIRYVYRSGEDINKDGVEFSFGLEEATRALACKLGPRVATHAKREIGRMWTDTSSAPYTELFPRSLSPVVMYNAVRFWRHVNMLVDDFIDGRGARETRVIDNARYMICALLMRLYSKQGNSWREIEASPDEWLTRHHDICVDFMGACSRIYESLNGTGYITPYFKSVENSEEYAAAAWSELESLSSSRGLEAEPGPGEQGALF